MKCIACKVNEAVVGKLYCTEHLPAEEAPTRASTPKAKAQEKPKTAKQVVVEVKSAKELKELKAREREWAALVARLEDEVGVRHALDESAARGVTPFTRREHSGTREATACLLVSDGHFEEEVVLDRTDGKNEYNLEIAERRIQKLIEGCLWHVEHHRNAYQIKDMLLWLGGDFVNGYLRDEDLMSNLLPPIPATVFAQERLLQVTQALLDHGGFERLTVVCSTGNHGRLTQKIQAKNRAGTTLDQLIYTQMAAHYSLAKEKRIEFVLTENIAAHQPIYEFMFRFMHGDNVRFRDAVGGIWAAVNKQIRALDVGKRADVTCIGHFHSFAALPPAICNGSLVGWNEYAQRQGYPYEPPQQAFFLVVPGRGARQWDRIWVDDSDE